MSRSYFKNEEPVIISFSPTVSDKKS